MAAAVEDDDDDDDEEDDFYLLSEGQMKLKLVFFYKMNLFSSLSLSEKKLKNISIFYSVVPPPPHSIFSSSSSSLFS